MDILKEIVKGTTKYFLSSAVNAGLNILFIFFATRVLGIGGYGLVALGLTVFYLSNNFGMFGFGFYSQKILAGVFNKNKANELGSMFVFNIIASLLLFSILFFGCEPISEKIFNKPELALILKAIAFAILFSLPNNLLRAALKSQKKIEINVLSNVSDGFSRLLFLVFIFFFENDLLVVSSSIVFGSLVSLIITGWLSFKVGVFPVFFRHSNIMKTFIGGIQFFVVGLGYFLASQTDRLMLGRMVSADDLGLYAVAASVSMIISEVHSSMVAIFMPTIADGFSEKKGDKINKEVYSFSNIFTVAVNFVVLTFFLAFGISIMEIFNIANAERAYFILLILSGGLFLSSLVGPSGALLNMTGRHRIEFINTVILVFINVVFNYFMIREFGSVGAAVATLLSVAILNLVQAFEIYVSYNFFIFKKVHLLFMLAPLFLIYLYITLNIYQKGVLVGLGIFLTVNYIFFVVIYRHFLSEIYKIFIKNFFNTLFLRLNIKKT